jgi:hypothetical protein
LASITIADNAAKKAGKGVSMNMLVLCICFKDGDPPLPMHHFLFLNLCNCELVNCNLGWILQDVHIFFHYSCEHL